MSDPIDLASGAGGAGLGITATLLAFIGKLIWDRRTDAPERRENERRAEDKRSPEELALLAKVEKLEAEKEAARERRLQEDRAEVESLRVLMERVAIDVRSLLEHRVDLVARVEKLEARCEKCPGRVP